MKIYKFETVILEQGILKIPEMTKHAHQEVEVVIVIKSSGQAEYKKSQSATEFLEKWSSFLGNVDPDGLKHQYLLEKHRL